MNKIASAKPAQSAKGKPAWDYAAVNAANDNFIETFCEAWLNVRYYGRKLARIQFWNLVFDIVIAIFTSSTIVSFFKGAAHGAWVTATFGIMAAVLTVLKPILNLPKRIERESKQWSGYMAVFVRLQAVERDIRIQNAIGTTTEAEIRQIHDRMNDLCMQDDPCPPRRTINKCQADVNRLYPREWFWHPDQSTPHAPDDSHSETGPVAVA